MYILYVYVSICKKGVYIVSDDGMYIYIYAYIHLHICIKHVYMCTSQDICIDVWGAVVALMNIPAQRLFH